MVTGVLASEASLHYSIPPSINTLQPTIPKRAWPLSLPMYNRIHQLASVLACTHAYYRGCDDDAICIPSSSSGHLAASACSLHLLSPL